jgi:hypothetical protein
MHFCGRNVYWILFILTQKCTWRSRYNCGEKEETKNIKNIWGSLQVGEIFTSTGSECYLKRSQQPFPLPPPPPPPPLPDPSLNPVLKY